MEYKDKKFDFPQTGHYAVWQENEDITTGTIKLPEGIVNVFISYDLDNQGTILEFVANGRVYCRTYDECSSRRYIISLAKRFVKEVTTSCKNDDVLADIVLVYRNSNQDEG